MIKAGLNMGILSDEDKKTISEKFRNELKAPVPILLLTSKDNCQYCNELKELLEEISALGDSKILLEIRELTDEDKETLGVNHGPIVLIGEAENIRYTGSPFGEEGWAFLEAIVMTSRNEHGISDENVEKLQKLDRTIRIETVITPSCPYCPYAALNAHKIAVASNGKVISDVIEAYEFPEIADKWNVTAVPTIILSAEKPYSGEVFNIGLAQEIDLIMGILKLDGKA